MLKGILSKTVILLAFITIQSVFSNDINPTIDLSNTLIEQQELDNNSSFSGVKKLSTPLTVNNYSQLVGTWKSVSSSGIVKVRVLLYRGKLYVKVYGNCSPTPCDWGWKVATPYANNVSSKIATGFSAEYNPSFKETIVTAKRSGRYLHLSTFSKFTDNSGRSNYRWSGMFAK